MPLAGNEVDANFFNLIHRVVADQPKRSSAQRRRPDRACYQALARIALRRTADMPSEADFIEVQCRDLTSQGCSFFLPNRPTFNELVVCFGAPPEAIYLKARIAHCEEAAAHGATGSRHPLFLVGCEFVERLQR